MPDIHPLQGTSKPGAMDSVIAAKYPAAPILTSLDECMVTDCRAYPYPRPRRRAI